MRSACPSTFFGRLATTHKSNKLQPSVIAFRKLDYKLGILRSPFNGLDNFKFLFASGNLGPIIRNTILYNLLFMVVGTIFPITVAILFYEIRSKAAKKVYQTDL